MTPWTRIVLFLVVAGIDGAFVLRARSKHADEPSDGGFGDPPARP